MAGERSVPQVAQRGERWDVMPDVDRSRAAELAKWLEGFLSGPSVPCSRLKPSMLPKLGGVYAFETRRGKRSRIVYVGLTGELRRRIYTNHLHGDKHSSQMRTAMVNLGIARDHKRAKQVMRRGYSVRFRVVQGHQQRQMYEGYATAMMKPRFSLYKSKEH